MRKVLVLGLVVIGLGAVLVLLRHRSDSLVDDQPPPTPKSVRTQSEAVPRPAVPPERSGTLIAHESSKSEPVFWTRESELRPKGFATPRDAYESLLYATTGGDVGGTAVAIYLTSDARSRAEKMLASLPPEKRVEYGTPERLIASLYIGSSALIGPRSGESAYQFISDEPGITLAPVTLGLAAPLAGDPAYRTIQAKTRSADGKESEPVAVFFQTREGWKWVVPPSMVDALGRLLKGPPIDPKE
jgi:hypothetical protein